MTIIDGNKESVAMSTEELRELDAFIAEHVFGWKWFAFPPVTPNTRKWTMLLEPAVWQKRKGGKLVSTPHKDDERDIGSVNHYTTDPAAAMQVLEKCMRYVCETLGCAIELRQPGPVWFTLTVVDSQGIRRDDGTGEGPTLPLAICKFSKQLFGGSA